MVNIFELSRIGDIAQVVELLKEAKNRGIDVVHQKDQYTRTPLHVAAINGHLQIATLLIENGAQLEAVCEQHDNYTALQFACKEGKNEMVAFLVNIGANVNTISRDLRTTPLHLAVERCDVTSVQLLLNKGANLSATNAEGKTPMIIATVRNSIEIVNCLNNFESNNVNGTPKKKKKKTEEDEDEDDDEEDDEDGEDEDDKEEDEDDDKEDEDEDDDDDEGEEKEKPAETPAYSFTPVSSSPQPSIAQPLEQPQAEVKQEVISSISLNIQLSSSDFICMKCKESLDAEIWQCPKGSHFICGSCHHGSSQKFTCIYPSCSTQKTIWIRNSLFEQQVSSMLVKCEKNGCKRKFLLSQKVSHESSCFYTTQNCIYCKSEVNFNTYRDHLSNCKSVRLQFHPAIELNSSSPSGRISLVGSDQLFPIIIRDGVNPQSFTFLLFTHPSKSKNGWQVWITPNFYHPFIKQISCKVIFYTKGQRYSISIPLTPLNTLNWGFISAELLFGGNPTIEAIFSFSGTKAIFTSY